MRVIENPVFGEWHKFPDTCPPVPATEVGFLSTYIVRAWRSVGSEIVRYNDSDFWGVETPGGEATWLCKGNEHVTHWMAMPQPPADEGEDGKHA